jgi:hypothetical protein
MCIPEHYQEPSVPQAINAMLLWMRRPSCLVSTSFTFGPVVGGRRRCTVVSFVHVPTWYRLIVCLEGTYLGRYLCHAIAFNQNGHITAPPSKLVISLVGCYFSPSCRWFDCRLLQSLAFTLTLLEDIPVPCMRSFVIRNALSSSSNPSSPIGSEGPEHSRCTLPFIAPSCANRGATLARPCLGVTAQTTLLSCSLLFVSLYYLRYDPAIQNRLSRLHASPVILSCLHSEFYLHFTL